MTRAEVGYVVLVLLIAAAMVIGAVRLLDRDTTPRPAPAITSSDECRTGLDPGDPPWWPPCTSSPAG